MISDIFIMFIISATVFGIFYLFYSTRHKERMAIIEKGLDANALNLKTKRSWKKTSLSTGIFLISLGLGFILAVIISGYFRLNDKLSVIVCTFIMGGAGLVVNYFILRHIEKHEENND